MRGVEGMWVVRCGKHETKETPKADSGWGLAEGVMGAAGIRSFPRVIETSIGGMLREKSAR